MSLLEDLQKDLASNQSILDNLNRLGPVELGLKNASNPQETINQLNRDKAERTLNIKTITDKINELTKTITPNTELNITPNTLNQVGEPIKPVITQLRKPEYQGLILFAGLILAAVILK